MSETKMYFLYASTAIEFKTGIGAVTTCKTKATSIISVRLSNKISKGTVFFTHVVQKLQCFMEALLPYIYHSPVIIQKNSLKKGQTLHTAKKHPQVSIARKTCDQLKENKEDNFTFIEAFLLYLGLAKRLKMTKTH